jgi:hypothetical protein
MKRIRLLRNCKETFTILKTIPDSTLNGFKS